MGSRIYDDHYVSGIGVGKWPVDNRSMSMGEDVAGNVPINSAES